MWLGSILLMCLVASAGAAVPLVDLCTYYNISIPDVSSGLGGDKRVLAAASSVTAGPGGNLIVSNVPTAGGLCLDIFNNASNVNITAPDMQLCKTIEVTGTREVFIQTHLTHHASSPLTYLYNVTIHEQAALGLLVQLGTGFVPGIYEPGLTHNARQSVTWDLPNVTANSSVIMEYYAEAAGEKGDLLPAGSSLYDTTLTFSDENGTQRHVDAAVCVRRIDNIQRSLFYQHGFTALSFFLALILGIIIVVLVVCILLRCCRNRGCLSAVAPDALKMDMKRMKEKGKKIMMDAKAAMKKGFNAIKDFSMLAVDESIILVLALKDRLQMFREIDNLDILSTIYVDTNIEREQNEAAVQTSLALIHTLRMNKDITDQVEAKVTSDFNARLQDLDRRLEVDFKKCLEDVYKDLSSKNKGRYSEMLARHKQAKADVLLIAKDSTEKEKAALVELLDQQHQTEENELTYILALEQNEEAENLRKEFAIRKRMAIKEEQQYMINNTIAAGRLTQEQADWLLKEHARQQEAIHRMYDDEISRQRMILEEKLARRRALALASEAQEDDHVEMLNTMAGHQVAAIQRMRKKDNLSAAQAEEYMKKVKDEMLAVKDKMEKEKARQEAELHKKLSQRKQQRLADKQKQQEQEIQDYLNRSKTQQTDGPMDPVAFAEGLLRLRSQHRLDLSNFENLIDSEHYHELEEVRNQIAFSARAELKEMERKLLTDLQEEGLTENQMNKMLSDHDREMEDLLTRQQRGRQQQQERLKEELAKRQQEWNQRKTQEKLEQEELREHEGQVVNKLINSQMSISEAERERILKEHEKQMVKLENSLTLNKLRQKRMLEEKLTQRRAQQLDKLQQKQDAEVEKKRRIAENNGEEDDEETRKQEVELMKKYAERRIAVLQGHDLNLEEEMAQIRMEMTKERAMALKSQEERLGAMIAALQMQKAREMAQIEQQQKAINNLKMNLMDDLTSRGILSNPECERIIQRHKEDQEQLNKRLDSQRKKQEKSTIDRLTMRRENREVSFIRSQEKEMSEAGDIKMMQQKLQARLQQRENSLIESQEREMQSLVQTKGTNMTSKIRRALLMHKQMLRLEQFRNQSEREMSQMLEDTRRQHDVIKMKALQDQELEFIAGLVKVGGFQQNELMPVLQMMYPGKTQQELQAMLDRIAARDQTGRPVQLQTINSGMGNTLVDRVRVSKLASGGSRQSSIRSNKGSPKKRLGATKKRASQISLVSSLNDESLALELSKAKKRGSLTAQAVGVNGGFEPDDYPVRPASAKRTSLSVPEDFGRQQSTGSFGFDTRGNEPWGSSLGGYKHNTPIQEEDYEYPRQDDFGTDYVGMGTGHNLGNGHINPSSQSRLPPLEAPKPKKKKKKKLLKKLAHQDEDELL